MKRFDAEHQLLHCQTAPGSQATVLQPVEVLGQGVSVFDHSVAPSMTAFGLLRSTKRSGLAVRLGSRGLGRGMLRQTMQGLLRRTGR